MTLSTELERALLGDSDTARKALYDSPWLSVPDGYAIKPVFPYHGAAARFYICRKDNPKEAVSVYLDVADMLGIVGKPYFEAYRIDGDTARFLLDEADDMMAAIVAELDAR